MTIVLRFIRDTFVTFSAQIIVAIVGLVISIIVARVLGPSGIGAYALIILVPTLLFTLGSFGIDISNTYFGGSKKYKLSELASNSLIAALGLGIILGFAFLAYYHSFHPTFLRDADSVLLSIVMVGLPFTLLTAYYNSILLGQQKINQYNLVLVSRTGVIALLMLALLLAAKAGLLGACLAWVSGTVSASLLALLLVRRITKINWSFYPAPFKHSLKFGIQGHLGNMTWFLNYRLDVFLVAFFMDVAFVGYYSAAVAVAEGLWYLSRPVETMIFSQTSSLTKEEANRLTPVICRNTFLIMLISALLIFALGKHIIVFLFGSDFLPAVQPLWILLPGIVALGTSGVLSTELTGRGRPIIGTIAAVISLAINIPLNILLIPQWGIAGAAFASTVSYSISALALLIAFVKISGNSWADTVIAKPRDLRIYADILSKARAMNIRQVLNSLFR